MTCIDFKAAVRWALVPVAAVIGFVASVLLAMPVNRLTVSLLEFAGHAMPGKTAFTYVLLPIDGALAAALVIFLGAWVAPRRRLTVALGLLFVGGILAWFWVGKFQSPDWSPQGPVRIWWPIIGTCAGGLISCILVCFIFRTTKADGQRAHAES